MAKVNIGLSLVNNTLYDDKKLDMRIAIVGGYNASKINVLNYWGVKVYG